MITFHVPGPPLPWMRCADKNGKRYTPKKQREYQSRVAHLFMCARACKAWTFAGRYRVTIDATFEDAKRRDIDNVQKQIFDALNSIAYDDDSQIDEATIRRMPPSKTAPGLKVTIEVINGGGEHGVQG